MLLRWQHHDSGLKLRSDPVRIHRAQPPPDSTYSSACASSPTISEQRRAPTEPLNCPGDKENQGMCINRAGVDISPPYLHTDRGISSLFVRLSRWLVGKEPP